MYLINIFFLISYKLKMKKNDAKSPQKKVAPVKEPEPEIE